VTEVMTERTKDVQDLKVQLIETNNSMEEVK
jgi:hypothetical protein